jgi:2-polyprenyl-6-hydroxyphenyl methylase/3-demethylubiquinone-9 3-methyltransferase
MWYRTIAPLLGFSTKHLASDRALTRDELSALLDEAGFPRTRFAAWTFVPKGDMSTVVALPLTVLDAIGRHAQLDSLRGGLSLCACKEAKLSWQREELRHEDPKSFPLRLAPAPSD